jgi:hypothetical protein
MSLRLFSWNGRAGAASGAWQSIAGGADLVFLQEMAAPDTARPHLWDAVPGRRWGSALVAKRGRVAQVPIVGYEGWVVGGRVEGLGKVGGDESFFAFSVHVPSPGLLFRRKSYAREAVSIAARIRKEIGKSATLILGGDFNIAMGYRESGSVPSMSTAERRALDTLRDARQPLVPLWQCCNAGKVLPQTLRWMKAPAVPYHCDGFFVPPQLVKGASCEVPEPSDAVRRASDHNPVVARLR